MWIDESVYWRGLRRPEPTAAMMMDQEQQYQDAGYEDGAEEEEEQAGQVRISELEGVNGISAADIKKLTDNGIHTVESLAHSSRKEILRIKGISEPKCDKLLMEGAVQRAPLCPYAHYSCTRAAPTILICAYMQRARLSRWDLPPHPSSINNARI